MIELKVHCDCGQKFKFDVEPVANRMPVTVACPVCGADGTGKANALLQQMTVFKLIEPATAPALPLPPVSPPPRIPVNVPVPPAAATAPSPIAPVAPAPPPLAPVPAAPAPTSHPGARFGGQAASGRPAQPARQPSFALGLLGAFLGALVGAGIYYLVFKLTGWRLGLMALLVGGLAGWGANLLGRGERSKELGLITTILVVAAVVVVQYFVALGWWHDDLRTVQDASYAASVVIAKDIVKAVPTGSDAEIRNCLAKEMADAGDQPNPQAISDDRVRGFREKELPEFRDLAGGRETEEQYCAKNGMDLQKLKAAEDNDEYTLKGRFLLLLCSKLGIVSLIAAGGLAYRLGANA